MTSVKNVHTVKKEYEVIPIELTVHDEIKFVEIWLTKQEVRDEKLRRRMKILYERYKEKKYFVAVYESGSRDLMDGMKSLLKYNRELGVRAVEYST